MTVFIVQNPQPLIVRKFSNITSIQKMANEDSILYLGRKDEPTLILYNVVTCEVN